MKICVLQPDYTGSAVDYRHYDPPRDLSRILSDHTVHHEFLDKRTTYRQLAACARQGYDIYINLCEGYLDWDVPSIDVIHALDRLGLPYTGPNALLYDPAKPLMKYVAYTAGVATPAHIVVRTLDDLAAVHARVPAPWFVKPTHAGDSLGISERSLVRNDAELQTQVAEQLEHFPTLLVEQYIDGREYTVLVAARPDGNGGCTAYAPIEFEFPEGPRFKTYALKTSELHPHANVPVRDAALARALQDAAERIFTAFEGVGYARLDFRVDAAGRVFFLEVNFTCSVFYADGYEGSADYIVKHDGVGQRGFAERIIAEGLARHRRAQRCYEVQGNALSGYGIFATRSLAAGDVVFTGEERAHRIVTRRHVVAHWSAEARRVFRHYAYPLSDAVYALWDADPTAWSPQNHACVPSTVFEGLNVVACRAIAVGEELTVDYGAAMNEQGAPFPCHCGSAVCRGEIAGTVGNSVTERERRALSDATEGSVV